MSKDPAGCYCPQHYEASVAEEVKAFGKPLDGLTEADQKALDAREGLLTYREYLEVTMRRMFADQGLAVSDEAMGRVIGDLLTIPAIAQVDEHEVRKFADWGRP